MFAKLAAIFTNIFFLSNASQFTVKIDSLALIKALEFPRNL